MLTLKRLLNSVIIRLPGPLQRRIQLALKRNEQKLWNRAYRMPAGELDALKQCRSPEALFDFACQRFDIVQNKDEFLGLIALLASRQPRIACEIGTCRAGSLFMFCHALPTLVMAAAIDQLFQKSAVFHSLRRPGQQVLFIEGASTSRSTRKRLEKFLKGQLLDFLFIDGDHSYEGCRRDFETYRPYVRPGGLVIFHDIIPDVTTRMGSPVPLSKAIAGGVHLLWKELKPSYRHHEFIDHPDQDGRGIGVIELPAG